MRLKFCGVCRAQDAAQAAALGADYVGVILSPGFPRSQTLSSAEEILHAADGVKKVGVFVNAALNDITEAAQKLRLDVIQLHGDESIAFIASLRERLTQEIWKTVQAADVATYRDVVDGVLLEGVTRLADVAPPHARALIIAGGLNAENVAMEVARWQPDVVDVSSGIERQMGVKATDLMEAFARNARAAAGRFGDFGGTYVPETLVAPLHELAAAYDEIRAQPAFLEEWRELLREYTTSSQVILFV